jgi:UDP-N-acetylglucosamine--N-acetylmuramyl-(pentapeptide) pyrophosphoryl-undecaprenol N-acetylglucosamine transferase
MNNVIVVTGGGTGGHLSIGKILIDKLSQRGYLVIYIGSLGGADKKWFNNYSNLKASYFFNTKGVVNQNILGKIKSLYNIFIATLKVINIFRKYNVTKVISVGGYSASPSSFGALITRKDFYIHEQNSVMGKLNKISSKWAKEVFSSYDNATVKINYPIEDKFFKNQKIRNKIKTIIFLGGSQGSQSINKFALTVAKQLKNKNLNIIHQVGINNEDKMKEKYKKLNIEVDCFGFTNNLFEKLQKADIAICRAGAGTIWELAALGIPALYIPYTYAAANHQYYNAKQIVDKNLGSIVLEKDLKEKDLFDFIECDIQKKSEGLIKLIKPNGIEDMLDIILSN